MSTLILLRHGHSDWNAKNLFTGWVDVDLNEQGLTEAARGAELLAEAGLDPDVSHTSLLRRAIRTAEIVLNGIDRHWIPVRRSWRLNERHYGALQGKDKKATLAEFGEDQFMQWRRSYDTPPPPMPDDNEFSQAGDPRYADLPDELLPRTEALAQVLEDIRLRHGTVTAYLIAAGAPVDIEQRLGILLDDSSPEITRGLLA